MPKSYLAIGLIAVLALAGAADRAAAAASNTQPFEIPVQEFTLDNGLRVIVHEDHKAPIVAINLWYHVGSKNEQPGKTGFAHLFEHLMFQGSLHHDTEFFAPFEPIGAEVNGTTDQDRTNYYEHVPSAYFELPLFMESDRMRSLLPALTQEKLDNQRDVVKNERRQRYENRLTQTASLATAGLLMLSLMAVRRRQRAAGSRSARRRGQLGRCSCPRSPRSTPSISRTSASGRASARSAKRPSPRSAAIARSPSTRSSIRRRVRRSRAGRVTGR